MKKLALLLTAAMLFSLLGCGPSETSTTEPTLPPNDAADFTYQYSEEYDVISITDYVGTRKDVVVPSEIDGHVVKNIKLYGNEIIESIVLPDTMDKINPTSFKSCINLQRVVLGRNITTIYDQAFKDCTKLESINFPHGLIKIYPEAFKNCVKLKKAILPNGLESIGVEAFSECSGLTEVFIPNTVTLIGTSAFYGAKSLSKLTFEDGIASLGEYGCFMGAASLKTLTIPASVNMISDVCFAGADALESVTFKGDAPNKIGSLPFGKNSNLKIYYTAKTNGWDNTPLSQYNLVAK